MQTLSLGGDKMDEVKLIMLGTGSPRPDLKHDSSGQVLLVDNQPILIDCGEGVTRKMMQSGIEMRDVEQLWFTHLHSDHVVGYGQFLLGGWTAGRKKLTIVDPIGVKKMHQTFLNMFKEDIEYRVSLGKNPEGLLDATIIEIGSPGEIKTNLPLKVFAEEMIHNVKTYAYRFELENRTIVISGDTAPTPKLAPFAKGADLLVHDAAMAKNDAYKPPLTKEREKMWRNLQFEHCTPAQAAEHAKKAGVQHLVLTHFLPQVDEDLAYQEAREVFDGEITIAQDLQVINIKKKSGVETR